MKTLTAKDAKYGFGRLIDLARAEPVLIAKHGRPVVVVMAVEEFERLRKKAAESRPNAPRPNSKARSGDK
jgi:prevent-host-death family protein